MEKEIYLQLGELHLPVTPLFHVCSTLAKEGQRDLSPMGSGSLDHKPHLVEWIIVCLDKSFRGLGGIV